MSELAVISYSFFIATFAIVAVFFSLEDDDDQGGGKMMPIPIKN